MSFREDVLQLVTENNYKKVVEVGVWKGQLSRMLYEVVDELVLVDPWSLHHNYFSYPTVDGDIYKCTMGEELKTQSELNTMYETVKADMPLATVLRMGSVEAATMFYSYALDFVFIDAIHTYEHCKEDIQAWSCKIRPGGMIAGDDYLPEYPCVSKAVDELIGKQDIEEGVWSKKI